MVPFPQNLARHLFRLLLASAVCRRCRNLSPASHLHSHLPSTPAAPQAEDFDEGVLYQLAQKRSEDEARAALRTLLGSDVSMLQVRGAWLCQMGGMHKLEGGGGDKAISITLSNLASCQPSWLTTWPCPIPCAAPRCLPEPRHQELPPQRPRKCGTGRRLQRRPITAIGHRAGQQVGLQGLAACACIRNEGGN